MMVILDERESGMNDQVWHDIDEAVAVKDWDTAINLASIIMFESWLDQKVKNPKTGRMVKVRSLPKELRQKYKPIEGREIKRDSSEPTKDEIDKTRSQLSKMRSDIKQGQADQLAKFDGWSRETSKRGGTEYLVNKDGRRIKIPKRANIDDIPKLIAKSEVQNAAQKRDDLQKVKDAVQKVDDLQKMKDAATARRVEAEKRSAAAKKRIAELRAKLKSLKGKR